MEQLTDVLNSVVLPKLDGLRKVSGGYMARCPAHEDSKPSLSVTVGTEHPVLLHCHAGCDRDDILARLGLTWTDVCAPRDDAGRPRGEWTPFGDAVAVYSYYDEQGTLLFEVCRTADKQFPCRVPDSSAKNGWRWKLGDTRRVLYRLPDVMAAVNEGRVVYVVEGEKDVHKLEAAGCVATCNPGGAGKWRPEFAEVLRDATVTIVADKDEPGQKHARQVRDSLDGTARVVRIVEAAGMGKDAADHLAAGFKVDDLVELWSSTEPVKADLAPDLWEFIATEDEPYDWIVPGLLERGDRLMLTGFEGLGKSMLVRQMAVMIAAGLDPFNPSRTFPSKKVLLIDCENSERQGRRKFRPLAAASIKARHRVPDGALRLIHRPEGIDLTRDDDAAWLMERVTAHQPDVLFIGSLYKLHAANMNEELPARKVVALLDLIRTKVDCALVVEAHAGHGEHGRNRSVRPTGSSLFLRWPEFGYGIAPAEDPEPGRPCTVVAVLPWRGGRDDDRNWPTHLAWGADGDWPWQPSPPPEEVRGRK